MSDFIFCGFDRIIIELVSSWDVMTVLKSSFCSWLNEPEISDRIFRISSAFE